jgi:hypothetical protein
MIESDRAALTNPTLGSPDPLRACLSDADDRLLVNRWMPPNEELRRAFGLAGAGSTPCGAFQSALRRCSA